MEGIARIPELRGLERAGLGFGIVRVKHQLGAATRGPAHRLGITEALVADGDAEAQPFEFEHLAFAARFVGRVFTRVELHLVLEVCDLAVWPHDSDRQARPVRNEALGPEQHADVVRTRCLGNTCQRRLQEIR